MPKPDQAKKHLPAKYNMKVQTYKGVKVQLILYTEQHFARLKAKRFLLIGQNKSQNIWIPNSFLLPDGTLDPDKDLDWLFQQAWRQNKFYHAGIGIDPFTWQEIDPKINCPRPDNMANTDRH